MKKFKILNIALVVILMGTIFTGCGSKNNSKTIKPITLNIIDIAGSMKLVGDAIDQFKAANPNLIGDVVVTNSTALEAPSLLKAQLLNENMQTDLVFTGIDGLYTYR
jgi:putative spermidine/putrescine transport system substrate-binding protein